MAAGRGDSTAADAQQHAHHVSLDTHCHCLVVDSSRVLEGDRLKLTEALALGGRDLRSRAELKAFTAKWLVKLQEADIITVYITTARAATLHINFKDLSGLAHAVQSYEFLARCGSVRKSPAEGQWGNAAACDPNGHRHQLPEMLQFTCDLSSTPSASAGRGAKDLVAHVGALLMEHHIEHSSWWMSSFVSNQLTRNAGVNKNLPGTFSFFVLPRVVEVSGLVNELHLKLKLWDAPLKVQAPNTAALVRCGQCGKLGHAALSCPSYSGVGLRILFKNPVPLGTLQQLQSYLTGCTLAYLGSSQEEVIPSRRATFIFPVAESDESALAAVLNTTLPIIQQHHHLLHSVHLVKPKDRLRECKQCGSVIKPHVCPFGADSDGTARFAKAASAAAPRPRGSAVSPPSVAAASVTPVSSSSRTTGSIPVRHGTGDMPICHSWRLKKVCVHEQNGQVCRFLHPKDCARMPAGTCFEMADRGKCSKGDQCPFNHGAPAAAAVIVPLPWLLAVQWRRPG